MFHARLHRAASLLAVAVPAGLFLTPAAARTPETDPLGQCEHQDTSAAPGSKEANNGKSAPQAVSHDLRTNVVARANMSPLPATASPIAATACADHAINTKGTGTSGRAKGGSDCDDSDSARAPAPATSTVGPETAGRTESACLAIKTKGTSAK